LLFAILTLGMLAAACNSRTEKVTHGNHVKKVHYDAKTGRYYYVVRQHERVFA
jgi:hypothetical protein